MYLCSEMSETFDFFAIRGIIIVIPIFFTTKHSELSRLKMFNKDKMVRLYIYDTDTVNYLM